MEFLTFICNALVSIDDQFHVYKNDTVQIKKKNGNMWYYKVGINAIIANIVNVCL